MAYDPFPYQPQLRTAFGFSAGATHQNAVNQLVSWLRLNAPQVVAKVQQANPSLLDAEKVVGSGMIAPVIIPRKGASGRAFGALGQEAPIPDVGTVYSYDIGADTTGSAADTSIVSQWGKSIMDIAKGVLAVKQQRDLVKLNIARAEKGLSPIDAGGIAPQVNVGLSPQTQTLAIWGIGGLMLVGLVAAMRKSK